MRPSLLAKMGLIFLLLSVLTACAKKEMAYTLPLAAERVISLRIGDEALAPSTIQALQGDRLLLQVANETEKTHYLTVKNPRGEFIRSIVLPAGETVDIPLLLTESGTWKFYGANSLPDSLHPRGSILVGPRQETGG